jgi:NAD(P) transhydrogenase subunit alpha
MKAAETAGGYAKEMGEDFQRRQREHVAEALKKTDIVINTALVPAARRRSLSLVRCLPV